MKPPIKVTSIASANSKSGESMSSKRMTSSLDQLKGGALSVVMLRTVKPKPCPVHSFK